VTSEIGAHPGTVEGMRNILLALLLSGCTQQAEPRVADVARAVCPPPDLFEHAVCVCGDLEQVGDLTVKAGPAGIGSVGVNGFTSLVNKAEVAGTWYAWGGFSAVGVSVGDSLVTPKDVDIVGEATIRKELITGGDLTGVGTLHVDTLRLGGREVMTGEATIANRQPYAGAGSAPCGCDESSFFDVKQAVLAAKQATDGEPAWSHVGSTEIRLATGSYYITSAELVGDSRIVIDGAVSLFVDGSISAVGDTRWQLATGATLDLFVSGNVEHVGSLAGGDAAAPGAFRLYVGGTHTATIGDAAFYGSLYAPRATVSYVGDARIDGSIFAKQLDAVGNLTVEYGEPLTPPQSCETPPSTSGAEPVHL
jgi:hypothetical protein